jgi:small subunit ribosomal protein S17
MADEPDETPQDPAEGEQPDAAPEAEQPEAAAPEAEPAADAAAEAADAAEGEQAPVPAEAVAEPSEQLSSKERRRRARSSHSGPAKPQRSPQERQAERLEERRRKAERRRARRRQERTKAAARKAEAGQQSEQGLAAVHAPSQGVRRMRQGVVVSDKAEKTITVRIDIARRHRRYEKIVRSSSTVHAHDENNEAHEGDVVRVVESRPLSRTKRWALVDVLERAR